MLTNVLNPNINYEPGPHQNSASLLEALVKHIDPSQAHFGKRLTHLTPAPSPQDDDASSLTSPEPLMQLHFADGSTAEANVVLGADGVRSCTRSYVTIGDETPQSPSVEKKSEYPNVIFSNTNAYRGLVPMTKLKEMGIGLKAALEVPLCWCGPGKV